ncbi:hypothetical protein BJZ21_004063 [Nocardioides panaciterrulae]|uniref:Uncharacterized protein n=1 Tax=Nocardioides panaciterrulae TaxID=661492 RepID=A0A7Y9E2E1_9ACTN|nr:hypothetical protein [Nocardioides panaciterrulae]NYD43980.1 hypothetical protein [Nocardioides panaciterrulae]
MGGDVVSHRGSSPRPASMGRRRIETTDEQDVHTRWYRVMTSYRRSRNRAKVKRLTRRRERMQARREMRSEETW